ncbi:MAG: hypothetical protein ACQETX_07025 [Pseudomonadota bacterium]
MKKTLRYGLLAGASGLALGFGLATAPAQAFDEVNWEWYADVKTDFTIDPEIVWDIDPEGLAMVESVQVSIGDINSTSTVSGVHNNQPAGSGTASGSFTFESEIFDDDEVDELNFNKGQYDGATAGGTGIQPGAETDTTFGSTSGDSPVGDLDSGVTASSGALDGATVNVHGGTTMGGSCDNEPGEQGCVVFTVDIEDMELVAPDPLNAVTQLPEVVSAATAVANNLSVTADAGTLMHNGQYASGDFSSPEISSLNTIGGGSGGTGNRHHDILLAAAALAGTGVLTQGEVNATSEVNDILNASVDSSATAVSNNISVSVNPGEEVEGEDGDISVVSGPAVDNQLIADFTQFSYMNVTSNSNVSDVSVNNYSNLGKLDGPVVNSTATSVGNNISVNVGN